MTFEPVDWPDEYEAAHDRQDADDTPSPVARFKRYLAARRDAGLGHRDPDTDETERLKPIVAKHESAARIVPELTEDLLRTLPVPIAAAVHQLKIGRDGQRRRAEQAEQRQAELRSELAAANAECARATKRADRIDATLGAMRQQAIDAVKERNAANERAEKAEAELRENAEHIVLVQQYGAELMNQRDEARARLAKLGKVETQRRILTADGTPHSVTEWDLENRALWVPSVRLEEREVYPMPWRAVYPTCRSCGTAERVVGDPPLCSNCTVYGAGWSSQRPDASLDGLRGPFTGLLGPFGIAPDVAQGATETESDQ